MQAVLTRPGGTGGVPATGRSRGVLVLCALLVVAVAVDAGYSAASSGSKLGVVLPIAVGAGLGLIVLCYVNFELFAFTTIAIRSSLDIAKSSGNAGYATTGSASASGLDPAGALAVLFMVGALFWWLTRRSLGIKAPPASVHRVALIAFAGAGMLSVLDSGSPFVSILEFIRVAAVAVMLAVMEVLLIERPKVKRLLVAIYLSAIVPVAVALFSVFTHHAQFSSGGFDRYEGTFSQPNPFGIYLTMLIVMGAAIFPYIRTRARLLLVPMLLGCIICLYYTYTRSAWISCIVGVFVVAVVGRRRKLLALLIVGMCCAMLAVPTIVSRFSDLAQSSNPSGTASNSLVWRFNYWAEVLPLANKDPVTGIGLKMSSFETDQAKEPHNDFLRAYVETGVIGTLAYVGLLASMIVVARQGLKESRPGFDHSVAVGFTGCVVAFMLISAVSNVISEVVVLWYYVAFAAAAYGVTQFREDRPLSVAS